MSGRSNVAAGDAPDSAPLGRARSADDSRARRGYSHRSRGPPEPPSVGGSARDLGDGHGRKHRSAGRRDARKHGHHKRDGDSGSHRTPSRSPRSGGGGGDRHARSSPRDGAQQSSGESPADRWRKRQHRLREARHAASGGVAGVAAKAAHRHRLRTPRGQASARVLKVSSSEGEASDADAPEDGPEASPAAAVGGHDDDAGSREGRHAGRDDSEDHPGGGAPAGDDTAERRGDEGTMHETDHAYDAGHYDEAVTDEDDEEEHEDVVTLTRGSARSLRLNLTGEEVSSFRSTDLMAGADEVKTDEDGPVTPEVRLSGERRRRKSRSGKRRSRKSSTPVAVAQRSRALQSLMLRLHSAASTNTDGRVDVLGGLEESKTLAEEYQEQLVTGVRNNFILEHDISEVEQRIELLVKNRMTAEDHAAARRGKLAYAVARAQSEPVFTPEALGGYGELLYLLKWRPQYLAALSTMLDPRDGDPRKIASFIVEQLYGSVHTVARQERHLLLLIKLALQGQFQAFRDNFGQFMRSTTVVTHVMSLYTRRREPVFALERIIGEFVRDVAEHTDLRLEIDPVRVYEELGEFMEEELHGGDDIDGPASYAAHSRGSTQWDRRAGGRGTHGSSGFGRGRGSTSGSLPSPEECAADPDVRAAIRERVGTLSSFCERLMTSVVEHIDSIPHGMRWISRQLRDMARATYPAVPQVDRDALVGSFVVMRYIVAAILVPDEYGLVDEAPPAEAQRNLVLIAKVVQTLANGTSFGDGKEAYMKPLNKFLRRNRRRMARFYGDLTRVDAAREDDILEIDRYLEHVATSTPVAYVDVNTLLLVHKALRRYAKVLSRTESAIGEGPVLRRLLDALGRPRPRLSEEENERITVPLHDPDSGANRDVSQRLIRRTSSRRAIADFVAASNRAGAGAPPKDLPRPAVALWINAQRSLLVALHHVLVRNPEVAAARARDPLRSRTTPRTPGVRGARGGRAAFDAGASGTSTGSTGSGSSDGSGSGSGDDSGADEHLGSEGGSARLSGDMSSRSPPSDVIHRRDSRRRAREDDEGEVPAGVAIAELLGAQMEEARAAGDMEVVDAMMAALEALRNLSAALGGGAAAHDALVTPAVAPSVVPAGWAVRLLMACAEVLRTVERTAERVSMLESAVDALDKHTRFLLEKRLAYEKFLDSARRQFAPRPHPALARKSHRGVKQRKWTWLKEEEKLERARKGSDAGGAGGEGDEGAAAAAGVVGSSTPAALSRGTRASIGNVRVGGTYRTAPFGFFLARRKGGGAVVRSVRPGSPAAGVGVLPGDRIVTIAHMDVEHLPYDEIMAKLQSVSAALTAGGVPPRVVFIRDGDAAADPGSPTVATPGAGVGASGGIGAVDAVRRASVRGGGAAAARSDFVVSEGGLPVPARTLTFRMSHSQLANSGVVVGTTLREALLSRVKFKFALLPPQDTTTHEGCGTFRLKVGVQGMSVMETTINLEEILEHRMRGVEEIVVDSVTFNVEALADLLNRKLAGV